MCLYSNPYFLPEHILLMGILKKRNFKKIMISGEHSFFVLFLIEIYNLYISGKTLNTKYIKIREKKSENEEKNSETTKM